MIFFIFIPVFLLAGLAFAIWWFFIKEKDLKLKEILDKGIIYLYEWRGDRSATEFDNFNIKVTKYLLTGKDGDGARASILALNQPGYFESDGGRARFCFPWIWAAQMLFHGKAKENIESIITFAEYMECFDKAQECADAFKDTAGSQKQMGLAPLLNFLAGLEPKYFPADKFINMKDHSPFAPEWGSSHYGGLGQFNLLVSSRMAGKLPEIAINDLAEALIQLSSVTRYPWSREYFDVHSGSTWWLSTKLYLMSVAKGDVKGNLKWIIQREIRYLIEHNLPISLFAPLFIEAEWDRTKAVEPEFRDYLLTCHLQDGRRHRAEDVYLSKYFKDCHLAPAMAVIRNDDIAVIVNLCPRWANKADDGYPGEILAITDGKREYINGACFYMMENPEEHSTVGGAYTVSVTYQGDRLEIVGDDGWTRFIYHVPGGVRISDTGIVRAYYHFIDYGKAKSYLDKLEIDDITFGWLAEHDAGIIIKFVERGFHSKDEIVLRMDGIGYMEVTKA